MKIHKILLPVAGTLAMVAFAPQASAIPSFARQTGMACSACHYQHFPVINSFGRSFKASGYTIMGAQEKIEADGLSMPSVLNASLVGYFNYTKTNGPATAVGQPKGSNDGSLQIPSQASLFLGGRGGEHFGYESEVNLTPAAGGVAPDGTIGMIRMKVLFVNDIGDVKTGIVPFSSGLGPADSFESLNTGAVAVHAFNQSDMGVISAQQYIGTNTNASGVALFATNNNLFANIAKWSASTGAGVAGGPSSTYVRGAWTTNLIPGFDSALGFQNWSGTSTSDATIAGVTTLTTAATKAYSLDGQMMGDVFGMPLLLVSSYAKAPVVSTGNANLYNAGPFDKSSFNIGGELGVIPNVATVQIGFRLAKTGIDAGTIGGTAGKNASDNAFLLGATYNIAQNMRAELTYSKYSGDSYGATAAAAAGPGYLGDRRIAFDLAFGF